MTCPVIQKGSNKESDPIELSRLTLMDQTVQTIGVGHGHGVDASLASCCKEFFRRGGPFVETVIGMDVEMDHKTPGVRNQESGVRSQNSE